MSGEVLDDAAKEMQSLINAGGNIDAEAGAVADAALNGNLDSSGKIIQVDADAKALEWLFLPSIIGMVIAQIYPETAANYSQERCMAVASAIVPVADKYGWSGSAMGPEVALLTCGLMFVLPAYTAHKTRKNAAELVENNADGGGNGG